MTLTTPAAILPNNSVSLFKNVNPYWGVTTGLAAWFLLLHTPRFWSSRHILAIGDVKLATHIITAATLYLVCIHNCLITPAISRLAHVWVGRVGLISGIISFSLGAFLAWSRLVLSEETNVEGSTTLGFAIPITIGGMLQIVCEVIGYRAIRKYQHTAQELQDNSKTMAEDYRQSLELQKHEALKLHISSMLGLFVMACSIPAGIRLAVYISGGNEDGLLPTALIIIIIVILQKISNRYVHRMVPPLPNSQDLVSSHLTTNYQSISN